MVTTTRPYLETLQHYVEEYVAETGVELYTTAELAEWALQTGRWDPPRNLAIKKCREDFGRALREEYFKGVNGESVRAKHVRRQPNGDEQQYFWADIRSAPREHIEASFRQRREQIVGECRQLDRDKEHWNRTHTDEKPIQLVFDFTDDVEEGRFSGEYPPKKPR